ncbi:MAG: oxidoreductase [Firmicutes bacterium]|nr:oxidoreductase [Bacillota bacterium]
MARPRVAVFKFSSCAGCQLQILNIEDQLLAVVGAVDFAYFVMAKRENVPGPYDLGFVEGAITSTEEVKKIKQVRGQVRKLVALGSCACFGGLPSLKNSRTQREVEAEVYEHPGAICSIPAAGIDRYVPVDGLLRGCPIDTDELLELVKAELLGITPSLRTHSVCMECKLQENPCLFQTRGEVCLGPVTSAGCGARCPSNGRACHGCRGPSDDPNARSLAQAMWEAGLTREEIYRRFQLYAGDTQAFQEGGRLP